MSKYQYLFGPVPSRRYGRSLGIDLTPFKTCSMNCRFCQLGPEDVTHIERKEYVPTTAVLNELEDWKKSGAPADCITLAGSGEPTLHSRFGEILRWINSETDTPSLLLSNGSLFFLPEVRRAAAEAKTVKATLSCWDETSFKQIHRPHPELTFNRLIEGERAFRDAFSGHYCLEVFLIDGINDGDQAIKQLSELCKSVAPDSIQLNTAVRPPADGQIRIVPPERMAQIAPRFSPCATYSTTSSTTAPDSLQEFTAENLLALIRRHPCSLGQLTDSFGKSEEQIQTLCNQLVAEEKLHFSQRNEIPYYSMHT